MCFCFHANEFIVLCQVHDLVIDQVLSHRSRRQTLRVRSQAIRDEAFGPTACTPVRQDTGAKNPGRIPYFWKPTDPNPSVPYETPPGFFSLIMCYKYATPNGVV